MIKNIKKFLKESDLEHKKFLKELTNKKNIKILESLLSSKIFSYMNFADDDNPIALYKLATRAR